MAPASKPLRYDARVEADEPNTSHTIILDLVGTAKRVLDAGCASGYLSEALKARGNEVSGVEVDARAAEVARPHLERLVVGDLEQLDLPGEFGKGAFDVVVFADVLEHLRDPVKVLRQSRDLLANQGYVVISVPNVAHAAVRLALLQGRFDYSPTGLLDETHLRFFTRSSFEEMLSSAGFLAVDTRRTTSSPFDTEISVSDQDFPVEVIRQVQDDPDGLTYQFVVRAEPTDSASGPIAESLARRNVEVNRLRTELLEISRLSAGGSSHPLVGVIDWPGDGTLPALSDIRWASVVAELRRRLAGFEFKALSLRPGAVASGLGDEPVQAIVPWGSERAAQLASELDAIVVPAAGRLTDVGRRVVTDLAEAGIEVCELDDAPSVPDPIVLCARLVGARTLDSRLVYLKTTLGLPGDSGYILRLIDPTRPGALAAMKSVETVARRSGRPVIDVEADVGPLDLMALVGSAHLVATDSVGLAAVAVGLGRPVLGVTDQTDGRFAPWSEPTTVPAGPAEMLASLGEALPDGARRQELLAVLASRSDRTFDDLSGQLAVAGGARLAQSVPQRLRELTERVRTLEVVNRGLRESLERERSVMAAEVARLSSYPDANGEVPPTTYVEAYRLGRDLVRAETEVNHLQSEIERIYATRTMRVVAPVRRIYSRLRSLAR